MHCTPVRLLLMGTCAVLLLDTVNTVITAALSTFSLSTIKLKTLILVHVQTTWLYLTDWLTSHYKASCFGCALKSTVNLAVLALSDFELIHNYRILSKTKTMISVFYTGHRVITG